MDLRGAVALVTSGNGGLGQRTCHPLAKRGVHIGVMYAHSHDQAGGVVRWLASSHRNRRRCVWVRYRPSGTRPAAAHAG
jgi:3-oxoacyl-[acyl-carrier protein] reductase